MVTKTTSRLGSGSRFILVILLAAWLAPAPLDAAPKTIRYVPQADPGALDPVLNSSYIAQEHGYMVYDTLYSLDDNLVPQPEMVDSYSISADGLLYTFTLRPGLKFTDGSPVRAADAVASVRRWAARDTNGRKMVELGMTLAVVDDKTFTLRLREKWGAVLDSLAKVAGSAMFVMREQEANTPPTAPVAEIVGSGPFRFVKAEYVPASRLVYEKNPDYVPRGEPASFYAGGKRVAVDRVEWQIIPDAATAVAALANGEVDIYESPPLDLLPVLKANPKVTVAIHNTTGAMAYMRPNYLFPPFDNVKAREALVHMVDQEEYMRAAIGNDPANWRTCWAWLVCGSAMGTEVGAEGYHKPDLAKARALLAESGYTGEKVVVMEPTDQQILHDVTEVAVQRMKEVGFNVDVQSMNWGTLVARRAKQDPTSAGGWNMFFTWTLGLDLASPLTSAALATPCDKKNYFGWPCDAEIERLRDLWGKESDQAKRREIAAQLQRRAAAFIPFVPVGQYFAPIAYRSELKDFLKVPLSVLWNVDKPL